MGSTVTFSRPDGKNLEGYLAEPVATAGAPGIVVIQEWWGVNDQIRHVADRLATQGYRALVPDLYRGKATVEAAEAEHLMKDLDFGDAAGQDIRGAVQFLRTKGGPCGVTGFCMGGALTLLAAVHVPEIDAAVVFYGYPPLEYVDAAKIRAPLMGHFALRDAFFPIEKVDPLEAKLREAIVEFEFFRYDAQHAFCNETQVGEGKLLPVLEFEATAAELAWARTMDFFGRHLR
jgi:carboxymethylenebutenolidase